MANRQKPAKIWQVRAKPVGHMTDGEKAIWAVAYVAEYQHLRRNPGGRIWESWQAAKMAVDFASEAVVSAQAAVDNTCLANSSAQAHLKTMVNYRKVK
jgi:hypothetical protein